MNVAAPGPVKPVIALSDIHFRYGDAIVLDGVSFSVRPGETFGLLGPNGCGKSTLLSLLSGSLALQDGEFRVSDAPQAQISHDYRRRLGVVFQRPSLDDKLTVLQNLQLAATMHAIPRKQRQLRIDALLGLFGIADRANQAVSELSGGLQRRVDVARALLHQPLLLLLDEPSSGLDEPSFRTLWSHLKRCQQLEACRGGLTIICATHRAAEAEYCDRLAILNRGQIQLIDTPSALRAQVSSDVVIIETSAPEEIKQRLADTLGLSSLVEADRVHVECESGHLMIPRLVESIAPLRVTSISLRQPSLADVFLKVTGLTLHTETDRAESSS